MKKKVDETDTSLISNSHQPSSAAESQQPVVMASSLPRRLTDAKNINKTMSRHSDAATSCEEILMTVHTNKGTNELFFVLLHSGV